MEKKPDLSDCYTYNFKLWHLLFPQVDVFDKLCTSNDKTYLFILSFVRCLLISLVLKYYNQYLHGYSINDYVNGILIGYLIINIAITIMIIFKVQKIKKELDVK